MVETFFAVLLALIALPFIFRFGPALIGIAFRLIALVLVLGGFALAFWMASVAG